jgi:hypothetical protein
MVGITDDVVGTFEYDLTTGEMTWSPKLYELHGLAQDGDETLLTVLVDTMLPEDRQAACAAFNRGTRRGGLFSVRYRMVDPTGAEHELVVAAESWGIDGASFVSGFVVDVTGPLTEHMNQAVAASAQNRAAIEQAKGAFMLALGVPEEAAFLALRRLSNSHNIRLTDLASRFLDSLRNSPATPEPATAAVTRFIDELEAGHARRPVAVGDPAATGSPVPAGG